METYENYTLSVIVVQVDAGPLFFPSKGNARITEVLEYAAQHGGVPLRQTTHKPVIRGLPESREGVKLIVARSVFASAAAAALSASSYRLIRIEGVPVTGMCNPGNSAPKSSW